MKSSFFSVLVLIINFVAIAVSSASIFAADGNVELNGLNWQRGPGGAPLGDIATFNVPADGVFLDKENTAKFMKLTGNSSSPNELGTIARKGWGDGFALFEFDPVGYVSDEEKDKIDADAILASIRNATEEGNKEKTQGHGLHVTGWSQKPFYDQNTHYLEWAILAKNDSGVEVINHQIRILGRSGVMKVILVGAPTDVASMVPDFKKLLPEFSFVKEQGYAEYRKGDRVAAYGLSALVAGGAAAVALKSGILQKFGKFIVIGFIGLLAAMKKWFKGLFSRKQPEAPKLENSSNG